MRIQAIVPVLLLLPPLISGCIGYGGVVRKPSTARELRAAEQAHGVALHTDSDTHGLHNKVLGFGANTLLTKPRLAEDHAVEPRLQIGADLTFERFSGQLTAISLHLPLTVQLAFGPREALYPKERAWSAYAALAPGIAYIQHSEFSVDPVFTAYGALGVEHHATGFFLEARARQLNFDAPWGKVRMSRDLFRDRDLDETVDQIVIGFRLSVLD
jgi:hypothetical protein